MPTATENAWIQAFETLGGTLSCAVSLFVAHRVYQERARNVTNSMLVFLFLVEAGLTLAYAVGRAGMRDAGLCQLQALLVQWFSVMVFLWISLMSYILFQWIVRKKHPKRMEKTIRRGQYAIVCVAFVLALALLCANTYGDAYMWCWITDEHSVLRLFCFELVLVCSWLVDVCVLIEVHRALDPHTQTLTQTATESHTLSLVQRCAHCITHTLSRVFSCDDEKKHGHKRRHKQRRNTVSERIGFLLNSNLSVQRRLSLHVCVFSFVWFFSILNRSLEFALGRVVFATALLQAIVVPLQGLLNALIYTDVFHVQEKLSALLFSAGQARNGKGVPFLGGKTLEETELHEVTIAYPYAPNNNSNANSNNNTNTNNAVANPNTNSNNNNNNTASSTYIPKRYSLFITTLNVGESPAAALQSSLKEWILSGHDVYAVGLQECVDLESVREMIHSHLGGPSQYAMFCSSLGSDNTSLGYHGYIALTLFVRVSEIRSGCIHSPRATMNTTATGTDLIIATAQNKGAAGVPLQLHDTHMAFVTCHLPSDSKGKSKLIKRNASAHAILKDVILAPEDLGFDLPLQHDHCFVFGDLNYRMDTNHVGAGVNSLTGVAVACSIEKQVLQGDAHWLQRKYNLLRHTSDPLHPSIDDVKLLIEAKRQSRGAWSSLLRADELRAIMEDGDAFYGFVEPVPCFAPSYKRRKGEKEGDCGDYTEFNAILKGFSNTGEVENMLDREREREREKEKDALAQLGVDGKRVLKEVGRRIHLQKKVSADEIAFVPQTQTLTHTQSAHVKSGSGDAIEERETDNDNEEADEEERDAGRETPQEREGDVRESESERASEATGAAHKKRRAAVLGAQPTALAQKSVVDPSKLRPPSYTDRILMHSLPDRASRITVQAYDLCDALRVSDHRAVSMTLLLEVNGAVMYDASGSSTHTHAQVEGDADNADEQAVPVPLAEPKFELYELRIADFSVRLLDWTKDDELEENDEEEEGEDDDDDENEKDDKFAGEQNGNNNNSNTNADAHRSLSRSSSRSFSRSLSMSSQTNTSERKHSIEGVNPLHAHTHAQQRSSQQGLELHTMNNNNNGNTSRPAAPQRQTSLWRRLSTLGSGNSNGNSNGRVPAQRKRSFFSSSPAPSETREGTNTNTVREGREGEEGDLYDVYGPQCGDEDHGTDNTSVSVAETEDKLLRELGDEALAWKTSNAGLWRKRVQEEQRRLQQQKQQQNNTDSRMSLSLRASLKRKNSVNSGSNKQSKNNNSNKRIDQVTVVFPLPVKDPLLVHRRIYDYSRAFAGEGEPVKRKDMTDLEKNQLYANKDEGTSVIPKEELLRHASVFQWTQSNRLSYAQGVSSAEARFSTNALYKVKGCASPELGAHALIKVSNASGYEFGSSVVCLSHLLHTNPNALHSSVMENIPLSSGGQKRGFISGKFSLRYLPSPLSLDS